jgi:hypothetical protein
MEKNIQSVFISVCLSFNMYKHVILLDISMSGLKAYAIFHTHNDNDNNFVILFIFFFDSIKFSYNVCRARWRGCKRSKGHTKELFTIMVRYRFAELSAIRCF